MALDSYTGLLTTLQSWLQRADAVGDAPDLIALFEAWANRNLRVPQMEQESIASAAEFLPLPDDYLQLRDIQYQGMPKVQLEYLTPSMADLQDPFGCSGIPRFYTIVGDQLRLVPAPDDNTIDIRIAYWQRIPALSGANPSNWLLASYPDAYLYGALVHGHVRLNDVAAAERISGAWQSIMNELQRAGRTSNFGSLLRIRTA